MEGVEGVGWGAVRMTVRMNEVRFGAFAGGTAAKLILATGIAGAVLFTVSLLSLMKRASREHAPEVVPERLQKVPQPYELPRQSEGKAATNGSRPHSAEGLPQAGIPTTPWKPPEDEL